MNLLYYKTMAPYYDLIIPRDIKGVCDSVERFIGKHSKTEEILDLGCGTGRFSIELAKRGYKITGLDIADEMLEVAIANARKANVNIRFIKGDIRSFRLGNKIDIIWARGSIGDLMGINDVKNAINNVRNNLSKKGLFIFDVRSDENIVGERSGRSKHEARIFKKGNKTIMFKFKRDVSRRSKIVTIKAEIIVKSRNHVDKYKASHMMRYYNKEEITELLFDTGFKILGIFPGYELEKIKLPRFVAVAQK